MPQGGGGRVIQHPSGGRMVVPSEALIGDKMATEQRIEHKIHDIVVAFRGAIVMGADLREVMKEADQFILAIRRHVPHAPAQSDAT